MSADLPQLSATSPRSPAAAWPAYDLARVETGIVHLGLGAFHRAHQAAYFDRLLADDPRWGVCGVSLRNAGAGDALREQDGLYTLAIRGDVERLQVIGAVREALFAPRDAERLGARLAAARLVTLTITEVGYCLAADGALDFAHPDIVADLAAPRTPRSAIGWIVEGLRRRREAGLAPFPVVSCDNLARNGDLLRAAVIALARARAPDLAAWIEHEARFPNSMVDAITPKTDAALIARVANALGVRDAAPVQREAYAQWVIESEPLPGDPDWSAVGVQLTRNIAPFAEAKLRLLNGAHSALAYLGPLAGAETVSQAMNVRWLADFVERFMEEAVEVLPVTPGLDLPDYAAAIRARFKNTAIEHRLEQIAMDGSMKLPIRVGPTLAARLAAGLPIDTQCAVLAGWLRSLRRAVLARRAIADPTAARLEHVAQGFRDAQERDVDAALGLFPDLSADERFRRAMAAAYQAVLVTERTGAPPTTLVAP